MNFMNHQIFVLLRIFGGAARDRTDDLLNAIHLQVITTGALTQLSPIISEIHTPVVCC